MIGAIERRCSGLDRDLHCPGSMVPSEGEVLVNRSAPVTAAGNAGHAICARMWLGLDWDVDTICAEHGADLADLERPLEVAAELYAKLGPLFSSPVVEQEMRADLGEGVTLTGHQDVRGWADGWCNVADHKFGYKADQGSHYHQMKGYGLLAVLEAIRDGFEPKGARAWVGWYREGTVKPYKWSTPELLDYQDEIIRTVLAADTKDLHPNEQTCAYCPRQHSCPALRAELRGTAHMIVELGHGGEVSPRSLLTAFKFRARVAAGLKLFDARLKDLIQTHGPVVVDGEQIRLHDHKEEPIGDPQKAWPIIVERIGQEEAVGLVKISKTSVVKAVRAAMPAANGKVAGGPSKKAAEEEFLAALRAAGAMTEKTSQRLKLEKVTQ